MIIRTVAITDELIIAESEVDMSHSNDYNMLVDIIA